MNILKQKQSIFKDIRFWIILFFILRLYGISNPPLEVGHNWRQTTVTMVSRNFLEIDNNPFYPRVDFAGEKTGITGMEFPLLNYMIYVVSEVFGYQHWYGRLINLLVSSLGLWYFFKLIRKYFSSAIAFNATIILAVSIWFQFSRKIMPDTFSMSLMIASIYYGTNYLEGKKIKKQYQYLFAYLMLMSLSVLSKLPSGYLLVIFLFFMFDKSIPFKRKTIFSIISLIGISPSIYWYFVWVPNLVETYGFWHFFMGKSFMQGFKEIYDNLQLSLSRFYDTALKFIGFALFLFGLISALIKKEKKIYLLFILGFISFSLIIFKAGFTFFHHNYYIIPFVPIMALVAGYGVSLVKNNKIAVTLLFFIAFEGIANQQHDFRIKENDLGILNLEKSLDKFSNKEDLIFINSGDFPTPMYFAHRKGWIGFNEKILDENYISNLKRKGLKYIIILKRSFGTEIQLKKYSKAYENKDYCIYEI